MAPDEAGRRVAEVVDAVDRRDEVREQRIIERRAQLREVVLGDVPAFGHGRSVSGRGNREPRTGDSQQRTDNREQTTEGSKTGNGQQTTEDGAEG